MTTSILLNDTRLSELNKSANSALTKPQMALAIVQARSDGVIGDDDGASTNSSAWRILCEVTGPDGHFVR